MPAHILVVDDDNDLRAAVMMALEFEGHQVSEAVHGDHALKTLAASSSVAVIVLDMAMPVMDGEAFLVAKSRTAHAPIPVVIFSSSPREGLEKLASVASVVHKTAGIDALVAAIRGCGDALRRERDAVSASGSSPEPIRERVQTDESLRAERGKTDQELSKRRSAVERSADSIVDQARNAADDVLQTARDKADGEGHGPRNDALVEERSLADEVLGRERLAADDRIRDEREQRKHALANLLRLEREETDQHLLSERGYSDEALSTRDLFLAMVSHDLRTMLGGIAMAAELLGRDAVEGEAAVLSRAATIQRLTARMNRLIGDLVDVASLETGRLAIEPVEGDLRELVREAVGIFGPSAAAHGIELTAPEKGPPLRACFDHERMLQVLANLLGNALKFAGRGAGISIRAERRGAEARLAVSDTGPGIPKENLEAIFRKFWKVGRRDRKGLGLGLYISRCILEAHGGRIWAESTVGSGSTFFLTLPVC